MNPCHSDVQQEDIHMEYEMELEFRQVHILLDILDGDVDLFSRVYQRGELVFPELLQAPKVKVLVGQLNGDVHRLERLVNGFVFHLRILVNLLETRGEDWMKNTECLEEGEWRYFEDYVHYGVVKFYNEIPVGPTGVEEDQFFCICHKHISKCMCCFFYKTYSPL